MSTSDVLSRHATSASETNWVALQPEHRTCTSETEMSELRTRSLLAVSLCLLFCWQVGQAFFIENSLPRGRINAES